jgi:receptor expression-enhancing protein 5/6
LTNVAGFVIPGYYSMEALFSASKVDDTQWLTVRIPGYSMAVFSLMILSTGLCSPS